MIPPSTATEALYMETGLLEPTTTGETNRIMMSKRLDNNQSDMVKNIRNAKPKKGWEEITQYTKIKYGIEDNDLIGTKYSAKKTIKEKIARKTKITLENRAEEKSKIKFLLEGLNNDWKPGRRANYLNKLSRIEASTIFKARNRMLDVKANFKNKHRDQACRKCNNALETQVHILEECSSIHSSESTKVKRESYFNTENIEETKETAKKIQRIIGQVIG
jgi:hypothetical protein